MPDTPAEQAASTVGAVVENALAAADIAVADANARAEAAREAAALVTEAAIERAISERVDDCEEGIEQCENRVEALQNQMTALNNRLTEMQTTLSQQVTMEILTSELAKLSAQTSTHQPSHPNQATTSLTNTEEGGGAQEVPEPPKQKRYHLT